MRTETPEQQPRRPGNGFKTPELTPRGQVLRQLRGSVSLERLAASADVAWRTISRLEQLPALSMVDPEQLGRVLEALGGANGAAGVEATARKLAALRAFGFVTDADLEAVRSGPVPAVDELDAEMARAHLVTRESRHRAWQLGSEPVERRAEMGAA